MGKNFQNFRKKEDIIAEAKALECKRKTDIEEVNKTGIPGPQGKAGPPGADGAPGANGTDGISIEWLGTFTTAPVSPTLNQAYRNSTDGIAYVWDGATWEEMVEDGATGPQGPQGEPGPSSIAGNLYLFNNY